MIRRSARCKYEGLEDTTLSAGSICAANKLREWFGNLIGGFVPGAGNVVVAVFGLESSDKRGEEE